MYDMKKYLSLVILLLALCASSFCFGQDRTELDASSLTQGGSFHITVTISSPDEYSFAETENRFTALLCPVDDAEACLSMSISKDEAEDVSSLRVSFAVDELPYAGDYTLDINYADASGKFVSEAGAYLLRGVREDPLMGETKVILTPSVTAEDGSVVHYGSIAYVGEPYYLNITSDHVMSDKVIVTANLPAELPIADDCGCALYIRDGQLRIPGGSWDEASGGTFRCELRFKDAAFFNISVIGFNLETAQQYTELDGQISSYKGVAPFTMDALSWTDYPNNIQKIAATHQFQISDSRGNLVCSDTVACSAFTADEVYTITYKFPADWGTALPSGKDFGVDIQWPADWAAALRESSNDALVATYGNPCIINEDNMTLMALDEKEPGRYSVSCTFMPNGIADPTSTAAVVRNPDTAYQLSDLNLYLPQTILKTQAVLTPSLTMRMTESSPMTEQLRGGMLEALYRSVGEYPNTAPLSEEIAEYTLIAEIDGVSASRVPQSGDRVRVTWSLLDELRNLGDLPSCFTPDVSGYSMGTLTQTEDGAWTAQCSFYLPRTVNPALTVSGIDLQLVSGAYQTTARIEVAGQPIRKDTLYVNLTIPDRMLLGQHTQLKARIADANGSFTEYHRAALNAVGVTLQNNWEYNDKTTCGGNFALTVDGNASCDAYFDQETSENSNMHFELISSAIGDLFDVQYTPAQDFEIKPVTPVSASLSVKLFHAGTEEPLPADTDAAFIAGDAYQLKFYLTLDEAYRSAVDGIAVNDEGMVTDWPQALEIRWPPLNRDTGTESLNFYRDGDQYVASRDFSFTEGGRTLDGNYSQLNMEVSIPGWDVNVQGGGYAIQLPARVDKHQPILTISDFSVPGTTDTVADLRVNEEASFDVNFDGDMSLFDPQSLQVGYESNGFTTPLSCQVDADNRQLHCTITPQCMDYSYGEFSVVCSSNQILYAVYAGDPINNSAEAEPKTFAIKRGEVQFASVSEGSLSKNDMRSVRAASEDMQNMGYGSLNIDGWLVDSYLPRQICDNSGCGYQSYPVTFRYTAPSNAILDQSLLCMDVVIQYGSAGMPTEETVTISPSYVTDSEIGFQLDFNSSEYTDSGMTVREMLEKAVTIKSIAVRYKGSSDIGSTSANFESEDLTFALKVASVYSLELDTSSPDAIAFGGALSSEMLLYPFTVNCSQLYIPMHCFTDAPTYVYDENNELIAADPEEGCWGNVKTSAGLNPRIYVSEIASPLCYLTAFDGNELVIGTNE